MLVKRLDRCDNPGYARACFAPARLRSYIRETEQFVLPRLEELICRCSEYANQTFLFRYQLLTLIESIQTMSVPAARP